MNEELIIQFIERFPLLEKTLSMLDEHNIPWMIGGSGALFLLGNKRTPDDVDIYLRDEDHDKADALFAIASFEYTSETEQVRNSNPYDSHSMQLTSHLHIKVGSRDYDLHITEDVLSNCIEFLHNNRTYRLLPPEEVLLIKALLQRGEDVGKKDIEDINAFMRIYAINRIYLSKRISALGAEERVGTIFTHLY